MIYKKIADIRAGELAVRMLLEIGGHIFEIVGVEPDERTVVIHLDLIAITNAQPILVNSQMAKLTLSNELIMEIVEANDPNISPLIMDLVKDLPGTHQDDTMREKLGLPDNPNGPKAKSQE